MNDSLKCIIDYKPDKNEDYYAILGCDELSSKEQIAAEYKARVLHCHPDKHPNNPEKAAEFERIATARDVLCDDEKRANYDKWRHAGISMPFSQWCNLRGATHTSMHWMTPKKETMIEASDGLDHAEPSSSSSFSIHHSSESLKDMPVNKHVNEVHASWRRDQPSESLRKFRNYEI